MSLDPNDPGKLASGVNSDVAINPSGEEVVRPLVGIEKTSAAPSVQKATPSAPSPSPEFSWIAKHEKFGNWAMVAVVIVMSLLAAYAIKRAFSASSDLASSARHQTSRFATGSRGKSNYSSATQAEAEKLLQRLASGDSAAAESVSAAASSWIGKVRRTQKTDQFITAAINLPDLRLRQSALEAQLAMDRIPLSEAGLQRLTDAVGNPKERVWALWLIGALGNRGIDPVRVAKIAESYLSDPDVNVRASAVTGLSLVGTDETIPMLLDRFRNDPSPVVQERSACAIAESGMYSHEQRLTAARTLVPWLDDSLLSKQQRGWDLQALGDITGQRLGADPAAWRNWMESHR